MCVLDVGIACLIYLFSGEGPHRALLAHSDFLPKGPVRPFPPPLKRYCKVYRIQPILLYYTLKYTMIQPYFIAIFIRCADPLGLGANC